MIRKPKGERQMKTGDVIVLSHLSSIDFDQIFRFGINANYHPISSGKWTDENDFRNAMLVSDADKKTIDSTQEIVNLNLRRNGFPDCQIFRVEQIQ